ncbi:protein translocase subunit, partial [Irineochytrium annulatum]
RRGNSGGGGGGGANTNFFSEFAKSFKRQVEENKEFQQNVKLLSDKGVEINESETMRLAREAMTKTGQGTSKIVGAVASGVGTGVQMVVESTPVQATVKAAAVVGEVAQKVAEPIMKTEAAKTIASGIHTVQKDLSNPVFSQHFAELKPKEVRDEERRQRLEAAARDPRQRAVAANPEAGGAVVATNAKPSMWSEMWANNPIAQGMGTLSKKIEESENPTVEWFRDVWYRTSAVMDETEEAKCVKVFREIEPTFNRHSFLNEATSWIVPEVLEAHLKGDLATIRQWCSEKVTAELTASVALQKQSGLVSDCKLLDLRRVDISKFIFLEETVPVAVVSFQTQEILLFRDRKTQEIKLGTEDHFEQAMYAVAMTKAQLIDPNAKPDPMTGGWKIISWSRRGI